LVAGVFLAIWVFGLFMDLILNGNLLKRKKSQKNSRAMSHRPGAVRLDFQKRPDGAR
jgi:hypothetical protein